MHIPHLFVNGYSPGVGHLGCFQLLAVLNETARNTCSHGFVFSSVLGGISRHRRVGTYLDLQFNVSKPFPKVIVQFYRPTDIV